MSTRTRAVGGRSWVPAALGSLGVHGLALGLVIVSVDRWRAAPRLDVTTAGAADWIDIVPPPAAESPVALETAAPLPLARLEDAPQGDSDRDPLRPQAPRDGDGRVRRAPAPDAGEQQGRVSDPAWRRDRAALHARLTDGASLYAPSHQRIAGRSSSPQAERRESVTGMGDQLRSAPDTRAAAEAPRTERDLVATGEAAGLPGDDAPRSDEPATPRPELPHPSEVQADASEVPHGVGALDSQIGARRFDTETPGRAADDRDQRAASDELHPSITDLSRAAARASTETPRGHGPSVAPGAVARAADGAAPSVYGAPAPARDAAAIDERTQDRRYQRYIQEIVRRVNGVREFPRTLALRLEQGETVVRFVLRTDGRISDGVRVQKSSGFEEFDAAATRAVERAAPFPAMPPTAWARPLSVSVRVAFANPLVR